MHPEELTHPEELQPRELLGAAGSVVSVRESLEENPEDALRRPATSASSRDRRTPRTPVSTDRARGDE
jgi:hypothetical protein